MSELITLKLSRETIECINFSLMLTIARRNDREKSAVARGDEKEAAVCRQLKQLHMAARRELHEAVGPDFEWHVRQPT